MHDACPDWEVPEEGWKVIVQCLHLPDPKDRHVLAAAIASHADPIVTINIKDFPAAVLDPLGITVLHPDEFLLQQLELEPLVVLPAFKAMRARLKNPAYTIMTGLHGIFIMTTNDITAVDKGVVNRSYVINMMEAKPQDWLPLVKRVIQACGQCLERSDKHPETMPPE